jgi:hypothetical protein
MEDGGAERLSMTLASGVHSAKCISKRIQGNTWLISFILTPLYKVKDAETHIAPRPSHASCIATKSLLKTSDLVKPERRATRKRTLHTFVDAYT